MTEVEGELVTPTGAAIVAAVKTKDKLPETFEIQKIGIGAGNGCDGQVLVYADALGMTQGFKPKFLRHFAQVGEEMTKGVKAYIDAVKTVDYPSAEESY
jgi:3-methyl-2-oxobutanoate hydroxymethyltransferase